MEGVQRPNIMRGLFHYNGNYVPEDSNVAAEWFQKAAKQNHTESQLFLGMMYFVGEDIPQDYYRALQWLFPLVMEGCPFAQYHVGSMCETDKGLFSKDYSKGMEWYLKAAEDRSAVAMFSIGRVYEQGQGVDKDSSKAMKWFLKGAEEGYVGAQVSSPGYTGAWQRASKKLSTAKQGMVEGGGVV